MRTQLRAHLGRVHDAEARFQPAMAMLTMFVRPFQTIKAVALNKPWRTAILIDVVIALLSGQHPFTQYRASGGLMATEQGVSFNPFPVFSVAGAIVAYGLGRLLARKSRRFLSIFCTLSFAQLLPAVVYAVSLWGLQTGDLPDGVADVLILAIFGWSAVLAFAAVQEGLGLSTTRAAVTLVATLVLTPIVLAAVWVLSVELLLVHH